MPVSTTSRAAAPGVERDASRAGRGRRSRGPSRRRAARRTGPSPRSRPWARGGGGSPAARRAPAPARPGGDGRARPRGTRAPRPRSTAAPCGFEVLTTYCAGPRAVARRRTVVGGADVLLLVGGHLEDRARGGGQAAEPRRRDLAARGARLAAAFSNTSSREAKNSVGSARERGRASAERRRAEGPARRARRSRGRCARSRRARSRCSVLRVDVERGVHPDEVVIALVATGDRAHPGLVVRARGGEHLEHERVVEAR